MSVEAVNERKPLKDEAGVRVKQTQATSVPVVVNRGKFRAGTMRLSACNNADKRLGNIP